MTPVEAFAWLLVQNVLQFALCVGGGLVLIGLFRDRRIYGAPEPISNQETRLATACVLLNSVVALAGWWLWRIGIIHIRRDVDWSCLLDMAILLLLMDFFMYATHRIVHLPGVYERVHRTHHLYELTRPLSLFVLGPLEVLGFGALWLGVLSLYSSSWLGIVLYLLLNAAFGALGHIGVEPFPAMWVKLPGIKNLTTSTFHAQHHMDIHSNFGFYTDIWDRLFRSLNRSYHEVFVKATRKGIEPNS